MTHRPWSEGELRQCRVCSQLTPFEGFCKDRRTKDGLAGHCRKCAGKFAIDWQKRNPLKVKEIKKRCRKKGYATSYQKDVERRIRYPDRYKARASVNNAIVSGKIKKEGCAYCGDIRTHAHHKDYTKPLDVIWLCPKHHAEQHKKESNNG